MIFETMGRRSNLAVLFFHAMGVTGASSEPVANWLKDRYYCILPTSTVYCEGQKYVSKSDEIRQVEDFLRAQGIKRLALVVASSIGADLAAAFLSETKLPVEHAFKAAREDIDRRMTNAIEQWKRAEISCRGKARMALPGA